MDVKGNGIYKEAKIVGFDPEYDLAVLKVLNQACLYFSFSFPASFL